MNDIDTLRGVLFETLQALRNKDNPMEIEKAKAITDVAQALINTAKVEIDFIRQTSSATGTEFFKPLENRTKTDTGFKTTQSVPGGSITSHRLR